MVVLNNLAINVVQLLTLYTIFKHHPNLLKSIKKDLD